MIFIKNRWFSERMFFIFEGFTGRPSSTEKSLFSWTPFRHLRLNPPSDKKKLLIGWTPKSQFWSDPPSDRQESLFWMELVSIGYREMLLRMEPIWATSYFRPCRFVITPKKLDKFVPGSIFRPLRFDKSRKWMEIALYPLKRMKHPMRWPYTFWLQ